MRFVWGIIFIIIGIVLMRYTFQITNIFGKVDWAERNLSGGGAGTYTLWRLVGLAIVIIALLFMFNSGDFLINPLKPVFGTK